MYKSIIAATDWFFVHKPARENDPPIVWRLAAWGVNDEGNVVGLVGAGNAVDGKTPVLTAAPGAVGRYLHKDQLTQVEREQSETRALKTDAPFP